MSDDISALQVTLKHDDPFRRGEAIRQLAAFAAPTGIEQQLEEALYDEVTARVVSAIRGRLWDNEQFVMLDGIKTLMRLGDVWASTVLWHRYRRLPLEAKAELIHPLITSVPAPAPLFQELASSSDTRRCVRECQLEALVRLSGAFYMINSTLTHALEAKDETISLNAGWAYSLVPELGLAALPSFVRLAKSNNDKVRRMAGERRTLLLLRGAQAVATLIDVVSGEPDGPPKTGFAMMLLMLTSRAALGMKSLARAGKSWTPAVRQGAVSVLTTLHPLLKRAATVLDSIDLDGRGDSERGVYWSLRTLAEADRFGTRALARASSDRDPGVRALVSSAVR